MNMEIVQTQLLLKHDKATILQINFIGMYCLSWTGNQLNKGYN